MRKIGITADCSSGLEYAPFEHDIRITRTTIHFGDETLVDGIDITAEGFYEKLKNTEDNPFKMKEKSAKMSKEEKKGNKFVRNLEAWYLKKNRV